MVDKTPSKTPSEQAGGGNGAEPAAPAFDAGRTDAAATAKPTVSHMLGEITWLLTQSPTHKHFALADLEWLVMPPLLLEQYRVFHGETTPVGVALWAYLSAEAEAKLNAGVGRLAAGRMEVGRTAGSRAVGDQSSKRGRQLADGLGGCQGYQWRRRRGQR